MKNNWITIYDNSPEARFVYVSESITDHTGWEPEELIGKAAYEVFHPGDHNSIRKVHLSNVYNERISSMVSYRFQTKNGGYIKIDTIIHVCYDVLIGSNYIHDENSHDYKVRCNTVDYVFMCFSDGTLQTTGSRELRLEQLRKVVGLENVWKDHQVILNQEKRFAMIVNRFSDALNIVYVSKLASELVLLDVTKAIGTPFYQFVQEKDFNVLQTQIDLAKEHGIVARLRFDWLIDKEKGYSEPVEAVVTSTDDGLVIVVRLSPKVFIEG